MPKIVYSHDEGDVSVYKVITDEVHHTMDILVDYHETLTGPSTKATIAIADPTRTKIVETKGWAQTVEVIDLETGPSRRPLGGSVRAYVRPRLATLAFRLYAIA